MPEAMLLQKNDRYSQRNNTFRPSVACMPTTYVMWCISQGFEIESKAPQGKSIDDYLMQLMNMEPARKFAAKKYPELSNAGYTPNEIHGMYHSFLEPLLFGKMVSDFIYAGNNDGNGLNFEEIVTLLDKGITVWVSGAYQGIKGPIEGHASLIAGHDGNGNLRIVDPYGNFHEKFANDSGYDVRMNRAEFVSMIKPLGSEKKNVHIKRGILK